MKTPNTFLLLIMFLFAAFALKAQSGCFENCWTEHLNAANNSNEDIYLNNLKILENLVGCDIPTFKATTINGKEIHSDELKGKVIVLNFWFIYCAPCIAEIPGLNKLVKTFEKEEVVFIAFGRDEKKDVKEFLEGYEWSYTMIPDAQDFNDVFCALGGFPMNMVFGKDGKLAHVSTGGNTEEPMEIFRELKPVIKRILEDKGK